MDDLRSQDARYKNDLLVPLFQRNFDLFKFFSIEDNLNGFIFVPVIEWSHVALDQVKKVGRCPT